MVKIGKIPYSLFCKLVLVLQNKYGTCNSCKPSTLPLMSVILFAWLIISIPATLVIGAALGFASNRGGSLKPASPDGIPGRSATGIPASGTQAGLLQNSSGNTGRALRSSRRLSLGRDFSRDMDSGLRFPRGIAP